MKKFLTIMLILTLGLSTLLVGCGGGTEEKPDGTAEQPAAEQIKIGMVTDVGGVNDNSFNQSAWEGLQRLQTDLGETVKVDFAQSTSDADYVPNINQFVQDDWDLTWGIGFLMADHIAEVAQQNPDSKLAIIDGVVELPNVASVTFKEHEGSFLVGVVAGMMTQTDKIGFVGGMEIPVITRFDKGFEAGVKAVNPDAEIIKIYTGAFDKPDAGKSAAATMYDQGADIIFHAAGSTGDGVFGEARDRKNNGQNVWVIGVDKDQSVTFGDDITLTSMMKRVDEAIYRVSKDTAEGNFTPGFVNLGLAENAVGLPDENPNVPKEVLDKVEEYKQKIISGEITVPAE